MNRQASISRLLFAAFLLAAPLALLARPDGRDQVAIAPTADQTTISRMVYGALSDSRLAYRPRPAYGATVENSIYIRSDLRGRGVGAALLKALIEAATERGFRQMIAVIGDSENHASRALHARLGFGHIGILRSVGWKHGRWLDSVLMQRALGDGDATPR